MRRISIGPPKDQRRVAVSNRRSSFPANISYNRIDKLNESQEPVNGHVDDRLVETNSPSQKGLLPRIRRVNDCYNDFSPNKRSPMRSRLSYGSPSVVHTASTNHNVPVIDNKTSACSPKRYPTHQPQFSGIGILPKVQLHKNPRAVLSEQNSSMFGSSVTVKVAAPDVLKPPTPVFVQVQTVSKQIEECKDQSNPCDTESVMTALREKRKRNIRDEETMPSSPDNVQAMKRRRQINEKVNGEEDVGSEPIERDILSQPTNKRPAISDDCDVSFNTKRQRSESNRRRAVGVKNALEASFSSSKRWMDKVRDYSLNTSRDSSVSHGRRSSSGERNFASRETSRNTSVTNTPRHSITLDDDVILAGDHATLSNTSTPVPGTSGRTTPLTEGEEYDSVSVTPKKRKPLIMKEGSSKRRLIPSSLKSEDFSRVPRLRNQLTVDDFERDRKAEIDRVRQMLQEVDDEHKTKQEKKRSLLLGSVSSSSVTSSTTTSTVSTVVKSTVLDTTPTTSPLLTTASTSQQSTAPVSSQASSTSSIGILPNKATILVAPLSTVQSTSTATSTPSVSSSSQQSTVATTTSSAPLQFSFGNTSISQPSPVTTLSSVTQPFTITSSVSLGAPTTSASGSVGANFILPSSIGIASTQKPSSVGIATTSTPTTATALVTKPTFAPVFGVPSNSLSNGSSTVTTSSTAQTGGFRFPVAPTPTPPSTTLILGVVKTTAPTQSVNSGFNIGAVSTSSIVPAGFQLTGFGRQSTSGTASTSLTSTTSASGSLTFGANQTAPSSTPFGESSGKLPQRPGGGFNYGSSTVLATTTSSTSGIPAPSIVGGNPFQFGGAPTTTTFAFGNNPQTQANTGFTFGVAQTTQSSSGFGTSANTTGTTSGFNIGVASPVNASTSANTQSSTGGFSFSGFGSNSQNTGTSNNTGGMFAFGGNQSSTTASTTQGGGFGTVATPVTNTTASAGFTFSVNKTQAQSNNGNSTGFQFGATNNQAPATTAGDFSVNKTQAQSNSGSSTGFQFGATNTQAPATTAVFSFGGQSNPSQSTSGGIFGSSAPATTASSSTFNFGQPTASNSFPGTVLFGSSSQNSSTNSQSGSLAFGSQGNKAVGQQQSAGGFGSGTTNPFGSSGTSSNTFGTEPSPFGNSSTTTGFGGGGFGTSNNSSQSDQAKPFDFSKSAGTGGGFNFPAQGTSSPAPAFGNPGVTPSTPGNNMFTAGSASTTRRKMGATRRRMPRK